jgi:hypothetical protein
MPRQNEYVEESETNKQQEVNPQLYERGTRDL